MLIPPHLSDFWNAFTTSVGGVDMARFYEAFFFGDSEDLANELAELVLRGSKRATAGSVWSFEAAGKRLPVPGDLSIVTSWAGEPLCVIETQAVDVLPFNQVSAEFAAIEGEGDGSLSFWQDAHRQYFTRECARTGQQFTESMLVACEKFAVVYRASSVTSLPVARADVHRQGPIAGSALSLDVARHHREAPYVPCPDPPFLLRESRSRQDDHRRASGAGAQGDADIRRHLADAPVRRSDEDLR
jgi:uncharacterized protein YhfF